MHNRNDVSSRMGNPSAYKETPSSKRTGRKPPEKTCSVVSLGCPKNLVDAEAMLAALVADGWTFVPEPKNVELVILNTCGFLESARGEAFDCLKELLALKKSGRIRFLIVTGCLVQVEDKRTLMDGYPEVDAWLGPFNENELSKVVVRLQTEKTNQPPHEEKDSVENKTSPSVKTELPIYCSTPQRHLTFFDKNRVMLTLPHVAYLKIAEGCDRFCSYCLIPSIRGRFVSKPMTDIIEEAERLAAQGVKELVLIAQETTFWGNDLNESPPLAALLFKLQNLGLFDWIRVLYAHPFGLSDELLDVFGTETPKKDGLGTSKIVPYIDLPLQHCNDDILKRMNRRCSRTETEELLARIRESVAHVVLRTSMIVGFPGETDDMFQELCDFMEKWRFERAGIFAYSPEPGTPAADMAGQVPERVRNQRCKRLYARQERYSHGFARKLVGQTMPVLIDRVGTDADNKLIKDLFLGRTAADAPDVDPLVYITGTDLTPGTFVDCEMVDVSGLDLIAVPAVDREG